MKIQPLTPQGQTLAAEGRRQPRAPGPGPARGTQTDDTVQISDEASAVRSVADAARVAGKTRELIAQGNREAVAAQPIDVRRLRELLESRGAR
ncbi:MAG: hypothetical protein HZB55_05180 [Deltaproteobacteria bacterium]|nr:hypothetical protein [Deltaproteobacteria bacterium]